MHKNIETIVIKNNIQLSKKKLLRDIILHFIFKLKNNFYFIFLFYAFLPHSVYIFLNFITQNYKVKMYFT